MRVLGIDPGYGRIGWGVIENSDKLRCLGYGCIETPKCRFAKRLNLIYMETSNIVRKFHPEVAGVEVLFWGDNVTTGIKVAMARGVIFLALERANLEIYEPHPTQVKSEIGSGRAKKGQMARSIKTILNLAKIPRPDDAADALAVALYAESRHRQNTLIRAAVA